MRFLHVIVAILGLLSVGHSAPATNCESLTQKIDIQSRDQLLGKWRYVGESTSIPGSKTLTKKFVASAYVNITAAHESDTIYALQSQKMTLFGRLGGCMSLTLKMTVANNTLSMEKPYKATEVLLTTGCPDCLVILGNFTLGQTSYQSLQLLSKRRELIMAELDEFEKQADCLNFPAPVILDPQSDLCSQEPGQNTENTDITQIMNSAVGAQVVSMLESIANSAGGLQGLFNTVSNSRGKAED